MPVQQIVSQDEFEKAISENKMAIVHFYANWSVECGPMNAAFEEMANQKKFKEFYFAKIEAELLPEISKKYEIAAVPAFVLFKDGSAVDTVKGASPAELTALLNKNVARPPAPSHNGDGIPPELQQRIDTLLKSANMMVFMKGNKQNPKCGFSKNVLEILDRVGLTYETFDILNDADIRQGLKAYSCWPTYPQVYVKGELVGGYDVIVELEKSGDLALLLDQEEIDYD